MGLAQVNYEFRGCDDGHALSRIELSRRSCTHARLTCRIRRLPTSNRVYASYNPAGEFSRPAKMSSSEAV